MSVKIRLRRVGKRNAPCHRIVVTDARFPRDGRFIENVGTYDPRRKVEQVELERVDYWLSHGAQPSETVAAIIKRARAGMSRGAAPAAVDTANVAAPTVGTGAVAAPAAAPATDA